MRCPYCQHRDSRVMDSRASDDNGGIRRRRQCVACGERYTTFEVVQLSAVQVVKRDGRREDWNREKLVAGLRKACSKRNISVAQIDIVASDIEARALSDGRPEVTATCIGELAMEALRRLDHIAYIRFASVYRPFTDIDSLKEAIQALEQGAGHADPGLQLSLPGSAAAPPEAEEAAPFPPGLRVVQPERQRALGGVR